VGHDDDRVARRELLHRIPIVAVENESGADPGSSIKITSGSTAKAVISRSWIVTVRTGGYVEFR